MSTLYQWPGFIRQVYGAVSGDSRCSLLLTVFCVVCMQTTLTRARRTKKNQLEDRQRATFAAQPSPVSVPAPFHRELKTEKRFCKNSGVPRGQKENTTYGNKKNAVREKCKMRESERAC